VGRLRVLLACLCAILGAVGVARAQEPEPEEPAAEEPAEETSPPEPAFIYVAPRFAVALTVGTPGLGDLQSQPASITRAVLDDAGKLVTDPDPLTRTVRAEGGFQVGVAGILSLSDAWAVRLGGSYGQATLATAYAGPDSADAAVEAVSRLADEESGELRTAAVEAALRYRIPSTRRAQPFVELGAAVLRWEGEGGPAAAAVREGETAVGVTAAVGVVVPFTDWLSAEAQAETRVYRNPVGPTAAGTPGLQSPILAVTIDGREGASFGDVEREVISGGRLSVGIRVGLGRVPPPPPEAPEADASTSPPGR
jgi:hypothetical protein